MKLENWVNKKYLSDKRIKDLNEEFTSASYFEHISINDFFDDKKLREVKKELAKLEYYRESSDLYEFFRTVDFKNIENEKLKEFREILASGKFVSLLEKISGMKLKKGEIDMHSLKLVNTDYLLCHDDRVQDRALAFIINLSDFDYIDGGELQFFKQEKENVVPFKKILPKFNRFNMFRVSEKSFHQIKEVLSDKERITIGGWFYGN